MGRKANDMVKVYQQNNEDFELMLKRFTRKCRKEGIIDDFRKRMHYKKPSELRRRKHYEAIRKKI